MNEPEAFATVYEDTAVGVLRFLARRTLEVEVARDLTAETFAVAFRDRRRFRGTSDDEAAGWIHGIARHLLARYLRSGVVERKATERLGMSTAALADGDHERVVELAGLDHLRARVATELSRLPPDQQDAIKLRIVEELPYTDVAARLSITEPTARARVSRGLRELAAALDHPPAVKEPLT